MAFLMAFGSAVAPFSAKENTFHLPSLPRVRPLSDVVAVPPGADTEHGADILDAVLAEIDQARILPDGIRHALVRCATGCTPDLAFRLLLRAISETGHRVGAKLSQEQYARLRVLGSAMRYGESLVSEVEYLVEQP